MAQLLSLAPMLLQMPGVQQVASTAFGAYAKGLNKVLNWFGLGSDDNQQTSVTKNIGYMGKEYNPIGGGYQNQQPFGNIQGRSNNQSGFNGQDILNMGLQLYNTYQQYKGQQNQNSMNNYYYQPQPAFQNSLQYGNGIGQYNNQYQQGGQSFLNQSQQQYNQFDKFLPSQKRKNEWMYNNEDYGGIGQNVYQQPMKIQKQGPPILQNVIQNQQLSNQYNIPYQRSNPPPGFENQIYNNQQEYEIPTEKNIFEQEYDEY